MRVMTPSPIQFTTLCAIFIGLHVIALPAFVWALRRGQFRGREQSEWHLDDPEALAAPPVLTPASARRARWMLGILGTLALLMLTSVFLVMFVALYATAHPATGKCPFF